MNKLSVYTGMATPNRLERLQLAALRLREIQNEASAIYRSFPELDRRPKIARTHQPRRTGERDTRASAWSAKLH